jgi:hypothetical protein
MKSWLKFKKKKKKKKRKRKEEEKNKKINNITSLTGLLIE